jgi:predicted phosphodiesterase
MTKVWILSDLHYELISERVRGDILRPNEVDLVIIAGDYHRVENAVDHARDNFPSLPLVMVCGNHEHYRSNLTIDEGVGYMREMAKIDRERNGFETHVLENESIQLNINSGNVRIIGATLWTDFKIFGDYASHSKVAAYYMNDYRMIRGSDTIRLTPQETALRHRDSRQFIKAELKKPFHGKTIVVTHHLPSMRSVAKRYKDDLLTPAFASAIDELLDMGAELWVHGHTHDSCDYVIGRTRVVCNPRGYSSFAGPTFGMENKAFDPNKVVEI